MNRINANISDKMAVEVYMFDEAAKKNLTKYELGGKGYGLVEMTKLGLPVPEGIVITTGMWPLMEYENGILKLTGPSAMLVNKARRKPLDEYLNLQGRFKNISQEKKEELEQDIDALWNEIALRAALSKQFSAQA